MQWTDLSNILLFVCLFVYLDWTNEVIKRIQESNGPITQAKAQKTMEDNTEVEIHTIP